MAQLEKELDELQSLSTYASSLSSYIYMNITGMSKIMKKFDKKFKRYGYNFSEKFVVEKYKKKNSDLLYIHQYKILDEVGACVEQLKNELTEQYDYLIKNPIKEEINARSNKYNEQVKKEEKNKTEEGLLNAEDNKEEKLLINENNNDNNNSDNNNINNENKTEENLNIKDKFNNLNNSIDNMEAFYHSTSKIFDTWMRYIKANEYKSHIYSAQSAGEIGEKNESNNTINDDGSELPNKIEHYLSNESYWNIRLILIQTLNMAICSTYIYPTIYYLLKSQIFSSESLSKGENVRRGFLCGLVISMIYIGGLISMGFTQFIIKKSYKIAMIISSALSIIGNILFIVGIMTYSIFSICFGVLITGFSSNTPIHRRYLLYFIPKRRMSKYLLYFKIIILLGNSLGPLISYLSLVLLPVPLRRSNIFNAYTFPGWLCFFASIIILILIIFIYSEPLSPTFKIYAEGQDPSESMKRADSFALDENLTIFESEKLNEINERVSNFNDENQFNDTNLVSSTINELIDIEIEPYGTVRKAFWIIMSYIFILSFTFILYITMCPVFLYVNIYEGNDNIKKTRAQKIISLLYFISFFLLIPSFLLNFFYISVRLNKILYIKILALSLFFVELLTTAFVISSEFPFLFYISFLLTILLAFIMEDQLIYFYTQIIPSNFEILGIKGLTVLHIMKYLGNITGSISSLFGYLSHYEKDKVESDYGERLIILQNIFAIIIQFAILVMFFLNSERFSDRPIRRIVYSKNTREIKRTEF